MKNKNLFHYLTILVLLLVLIGAIFIKPNPTSYGETDVNGALLLMEDENLFIINTHTPYVGEIEGTDLIAEDWENMISYVDQLPEDKETPILVYCRSGRMAETSAEQLADLGYNNVYSLTGGMNAWQESGRNLIQNVEQTGETKEFNLIASNWNFIPNKIEVNLGDEVILNMKSVEGYHGIALLDFGVNEYLAPGEEVSVNFIADKQGTFSFFCNVPCGSGHRDMGGQFIVN